MVEEITVLLSFLLPPMAQGLTWDSSVVRRRLGHARASVGFVI